MLPKSVPFIGKCIFFSTYAQYVLFFSGFDWRQHEMKQRHFIVLPYIFLIYHVSNVLWHRKWCVKSKKSFFKAQIGLVQESWKENANLLRAFCTIKTTIFSERLVTKKSWKEEESSPKGCLRIALVWVILVKERLSWAR